MYRIHIPDTHGFVSGRSASTAGALLAAADEAGLPRRVVRATNGGYIAPLEVIQAYEQASKPKAPKAAKPKNAKNAKSSEAAEVAEAEDSAPAKSDTPEAAQAE